MSGLIACTGEFIPIPGQLISLGALLVNKGIPGILDGCKHIFRYLDSATKTIMACGK